MSYHNFFHRCHQSYIEPKTATSLARLAYADFISPIWWVFLFLFAVPSPLFCALRASCSFIPAESNQKQEQAPAL